MPWRALRVHAGAGLSRRNHWHIALQRRRYESTRTRVKPPPHEGTKPTIDSGTPDEKAPVDGEEKSPLDGNEKTPLDDEEKKPPGGEEKPIDASFPNLGRLISDDFAHFREQYSTPKHPIVLAHGLMGFDELRLAGQYLPGIHYWRGITEAFAGSGIECITTTVPRTGTIEERAAALYAQIASRAPGREVNIVAHSMGGLDARFLISRLCPPASSFRVRSLTTVATPHRGSSAADMLLRDIGPELVPRVFGALGRLKIDSGAFTQLTTDYVTRHFNPVTPNDPQVRYFSYGASATPHLLSVFRLSHDLMLQLEGANDGLVSVRSAKWGDYMGTLVGVTHLDLINWTNRIKHLAASVGIVKQNFNAVAFYLGVADMLAREGF